MPTIMIRLPYTPESKEIASIIEQQVMQTLPGAQVTVTEDEAQRTLNAPGAFGDYARRQAAVPRGTDNLGALPTPPRPPRPVLPTPAGVQTSPRDAAMAFNMQNADNAPMSGPRPGLQPNLMSRPNPLTQQPIRRRR